MPGSSLGLLSLLVESAKKESRPRNGRILLEFLHCGYLLAKLEFCDIGKSAVVFSATHPSTRKSGGAREFYGKIVGVPTNFR
ncbi:hypothetical protein DLM75_20605 [Leptospira stimsonii]|uniref:Uncharacterized protein n=1 Tax=Leptospira stimsonii TaxID=2202203 RepID=A0A396YSP1_9LEPT|nr:hypothetical protein DLM75_20605 [Leptospira stimsonii]